MKFTEMSKLSLAVIIPAREGGRTVIVEAVHLFLFLVDRWVSGTATCTEADVHRVRPWLMKFQKFLVCSSFLMML